MLPDVLETGESWRNLAACRGQDAEMFYTAASAPAVCRAFCRRCPVRNECLAYALEHREDWGVWGNTMPGTRRALLKGKPRRICPACRGEAIDLDGDAQSQCCRLCGLSWRVRAVIASRPQRAPLNA